jgi:hypothetical protein
MGEIVIAAYRPRPGRQAELEALVRTHADRLRALGFSTDRPAIAMRAADGTILEVFEWVSKEAVERAHTDEAIKALWAQFEAACEYVSLSSIAESQRPFPHFVPV